MKSLQHPEKFISRRLCVTSVLCPHIQLGNKCASLQILKQREVYLSSVFVLSHPFLDGVTVWVDAPDPIQISSQHIIPIQSPPSREVRLPRRALPEIQLFSKRDNVGAAVI